MYTDMPHHTSRVRRLTAVLAPLTLTGALLFVGEHDQVLGAASSPLQTANAGTLPSGNPMLLLLGTGFERGHHRLIPAERPLVYPSTGRSSSGWLRPHCDRRRE